MEGLRAKFRRTVFFAPVDNSIGGRTPLLGVLSLINDAAETEVAPVSVLPVDKSLSVRDESEVPVSDPRPVPILLVDPPLALSRGLERGAAM